MPLSSNWRGTATGYVCQKSGSDANAGTTQALPKKTAASALSLYGIVRIRTGYYNESLGTLSPRTIIADGKAVLDGASFYPFSTSASTATLVFTGFDIINVNGMLAGNTNVPNNFIQCNLIDCTSIGFGLANTSLFKNTQLVASVGSFGLVFRATFINSSISHTFTGAFSFSNSVFDLLTEVSTIRNNMTFSNCAFEANGSQSKINTVNIKDITISGDVNPIGTEYADGEKFSGTATVSGFTITFTNCFWTADLGFNNPIDNDYTLKTSPVSVLYNNGNIIGAYRPAIRFDATHPAFNPVNSGVSIAPNVTVVGGEFQLTSGTDGEVTSTDDPNNALELPYETTVNQALRFFGTFDYLNGDWIDDANYVAGVNDEVRLTYDLQVYDEVGLAWLPSPSTWYRMEIDNIPEYDNTGKGTGDVDANLTLKTPVKGKRFRIRFRLRNNGA